MGELILGCLTLMLTHVITGYAGGKEVTLGWHKVGWKGTIAA